MNKAIEVLTHQYTIDQAEKLYSAAWQQLGRLPVAKLAYFFIWNGNKIADLAMKNYAAAHDIKTLFFEISNVKGKLFVDPEGTNAQSLLYRNKAILRNFEVTREDYDEWKTAYLKDKYSQKTVPQAKHKKLFHAVKRTLDDRFGYYFHHGAARKSILLGKVKAYLHQNPHYKTTEKFKKNSYVFFPLQVSSDTQILINGNTDLIGAISYSLSKAEGWHKALVIKPHPAEKNPASLDFIMKLVNDHKAEITGGNTFKLIEDSYKTITINSTVGLEAKILQHPVEVIGKALYENFDEKDIERYVEGYLINLDYFGSGDVPADKLQQILARADLKISD